MGHPYLKCHLAPLPGKMTATTRHAVKQKNRTKCPVATASRPDKAGCINALTRFFGQQHQHLNKLRSIQCPLLSPSQHVANSSEPEPAKPLFDCSARACQFFGTRVKMPLSGHGAISFYLTANGFVLPCSISLQNCNCLGRSCPVIRDWWLKLIVFFPRGKKV